MRRVGDGERRARLGVRHWLAAEASDAETAAAGMVGLHATDPATVYLAARARSGASVDTIADALYERRSLLRLLGMRRTLFVAPLALAGLIQRGAGDRLHPGELKRAASMVEAAGIARDGTSWIRDVGDKTMAALVERGRATTQELTRDVPELRIQIPFGSGTKWAGTLGVSTRVLFLLALEARIGRGRPPGSWTSTQLRWEPIEAWAPGGLTGPPAEEARRQIVGRWLWTFGPGTVADLRWWSGWTAAEIRKALGGLDVAEVETETGPALLLSEDVEPVPAPERWVAFLPALDPTPMGWKSRDFYLGEHREALFDRNGNIGPTVWLDGRVVGGWSQRADRKVVYRLLEDIGRPIATRIEREARRLEEWIDGVRVTPRFRTPLEIELAG